jgi:hypothetical protein
MLALQGWIHVMPSNSLAQCWGLGIDASRNKDYRWTPPLRVWNIPPINLLNRSFKNCALKWWTGAFCLQGLPFMHYRQTHNNQPNIKGLKWVHPENMEEFCFIFYIKMHKSTWPNSRYLLIDKNIPSDNILGWNTPSRLFNVVENTREWWKYLR